MANILIVDDEANIREVVREYCLVNGFECDEASDGLIALEMIKKTNYDVVVLDIMMPNLDGFNACKKIKEFNNIPIIMLSARHEEYDKLLCFDLGVDDYVTKPFSPKELMARIARLLKQNHKQDIFVYDKLTVDFLGRKVLIDDHEILLTPKEIDLLIYLINNRNIALSRNKLLETVWGYDYDGDDRTVDTHIKMLRKSLGKYRDLIKTVRGMGYRFEV